MTDFHLNKKKLYSKSSGFYANAKSDFFKSNDDLLLKARDQNKIYCNQTRRTCCKNCNCELPSEVDFVSHEVRYVFCDNCNHLNGVYDDSKSFVEKIYMENGGANYSINYIDEKYKNRTDIIYSPKLDFLRSSLPKELPLDILDVGCGAGYFVFSSLLKGVPAKGIDVSRKMIEFGNTQIEHELKVKPLTFCEESQFYALISNSCSSVISAVGVIEHLRDPASFFEAFHHSKANYIFYSLPMFSFSVMLENIFPNIYPRHLSGGHTHLYTEESLAWMLEHQNLVNIAEWRFGTDIMDLYRSTRVMMEKTKVSKKMINCLDNGLGKNIDELQAVFDTNHWCSEVHCVAVKEAAFCNTSI